MKSKVKKEKVITLYLERRPDGSTLHVKEQEKMPLMESLGLLEWAKAILIKSVETQNALDSYAEEEV